MPAQPNTLDVLAELQVLVQSIAALKNKMVFVYDENDAADKLKGITFPGVAIVYDGLRAVSEGGQASAKIGASCEMVISLIIVMQPETKFNADAKSIVVDLLQQLRNIICGTRSVTGHFYHFVVEAPAKIEGGMAFWVQRWSVPLQIKPSNSF